MIPYRHRLGSVVLAGISVLGSSNASASVRMPAIFGDHMVLQEKSKLPIWGWASHEEKITVIFKGQKQTTIAEADGTWRVDLDPVDPTSDAGILTITGRDSTLSFTDVLVGDVWIASGQSNMEFGIQTDKRAKEAIAGATDSQIRFFFVPWATALQPEPDIGPPVPSSPLNGKWVVCSPETMGANWAWHGFSAVGYYFAMEIRHSTGHPVGMIAAYKGGTPAQAWTSISALEKDKTLAHYVVEHQRILDHFTEAQADYSKEKADYEVNIKRWNAEAQQAKNIGQMMPASSAPKAPIQPDGGYSAPANLFNGMVAPLIPYAIKGIIWYQGESNADKMAQAIEYATLFPRMISDWRERWGQGNFPFLFVQLPNFNAPAKTPSEGIWPWLREAQLKTLSLPNTGMAVTIDIGDPGTIHPTDKWYVAQRLALAARHVAYGQDLVYSGPIYDSMTVEENNIRIKFKDLGSGMTLASSPAANGEILPASTELTGFGIADANQNFVWAKAVLDGDTVVVSSDKIDHPVAVRYDWAQNPSGNLYNKQGLPASPFRTDDWTPPSR
jgi:sialate O-acetylesterase